MEEKINIQNSKNVAVGCEIIAKGDVHIGDKIYNTPQLQLNQEWFEERLAKSIKSLGERYSEKLNFELPIAFIFNGLARNEIFKNELKSTVKELLDKNSDVIRTLNRSKAIFEDLPKNIQEFEVKSVEINDWYKSIKWEEGSTLNYDLINSLTVSLHKLTSKFKMSFMN